MFREEERNNRSGSTEQATRLSGSVICWGAYYDPGGWCLPVGHAARLVHLQQRHRTDLKPEMFLKAKENSNDSQVGLRRISPLLTKKR
jgi:hypothetical protein